MKRLLSIVLMIMLFASLSLANAEDLGVQVIGGPDAESVPMTLDDLQLGQKYTIDGYAMIEPVEYLVVDSFAQFNKDADYFSVGGNSYDVEGRVFVDKLEKDFYYNWR